MSDADRIAALIDANRRLLDERDALRAVLAGTVPDLIAPPTGELSEYQRGYLDGFDAPINVLARNGPNR